MQINKQEEGIKKNENEVTVSWSDEAQWKVDNFYVVSRVISTGFHKKATSYKLRASSLSKNVGDWKSIYAQVFWREKLKWINNSFIIKVFLKIKSIISDQT